MAAKSDPAELGDVEPLADSTATPGPARRRRVRDRRRRMPGVPVDARHWTGETRGVGESGEGDQDVGSGNSDFVVVANRLPVDMERLPDGTTTWKRSPGGLVTALEPMLRRRKGAWVGWPGVPRQRRSTPIVEDGICSCTRCG